jgi:hypothetical protein
MDSDCGMRIAWHCDTMTGQCEQRCTGDSICPQETICENNLCVPSQCDSSADCTMIMNPMCVGAAMGHGRCVEVVPCDAMGGCPQNMICNPMTNNCEMLPGCVSDRDCMNNAYCENHFCQPSQACTMAMPACPMNTDCVGGVCVPFVCRGDADCTVSGQRCIAGSCQTPPPTTAVTAVRIITPAGVVRPTTTYQFVAVALDQAGRVVPGVTFTWNSSMTAVATIDAAGLATGGAMEGTTTITASIMNGTMTITSPGVILRNIGPLASQSQLRVTVQDLSSGAAVPNATVIAHISPGMTTTMITDATGVVTFQANATMPFDVTAVEPNHDFVTILGVSSHDVLIQLPPVSKPSIAGGMKGTVDFSGVHEMGALSISLNGSSIASPLVAFDPASIFGGDLFDISVPGVGNVPVPAATTLSVAFGGANIPLKDMFYTRATTGLRAAYSFAGRLDLGLLMGGGGGGGNLIGRILPYLQRFDHGVKPVVDVIALPTVVDAMDINGNGNTTERVPDYNNFPAVSLAPDTQQSLRYYLQVAHLPSVSGGNANALIVIGGVILPGVGFVPLGLDGQQDTMGSGIVDAFTTKIAPPHGGLEVGRYAVLATAVRLTAAALPGPGSARLFTSDRLPQSVDLSDGWVDSPTSASYDAMTRSMTLPPIANVAYYRAAFISADGTWHVFMPADASAHRVPDLPPMAGMDRTLNATVSVDAIQLEPNADRGTIFDLATGGVQALDKITKGFARAIVRP